MTPPEPQAEITPDLIRQDGKGRIANTGSQGGAAAAVVIVLTWALRLFNLDLNPMPNEETMPTEVSQSMGLLLILGAAWFTNRKRLQGKA